MSLFSLYIPFRLNLMIPILPLSKIILDFIQRKINQKTQPLVALDALAHLALKLVLISE